MLNNSDESGHPYLVPDLRGNAFIFSLLRLMFAVVLSYMAFTMMGPGFCQRRFLHILRLSYSFYVSVC